MKKFIAIIIFIYLINPLLLVKIVNILIEDESGKLDIVITLSGVPLYSFLSAFYFRFFVSPEEFSIQRCVIIGSIGTVLMFGVIYAMSAW